MICFFKETKTLLTIHNLAFQGVFKEGTVDQLGLAQPLQHPQSFEFYEQLNLLKAGIIYSDEISTVSPQYAKEIQTERFGCGLADVLGERSKEVIGILNGVDYDVWNPSTDQHVVKNYGADDYLEAKTQNKKALMNHVQLSFQSETPVFGFVSRITHQKGFDLFVDSFDQLKDLNAQFIIQGLGDKRYYDPLNELALKCPEKIAVNFDFNEPVAHLTYAGADLFLVPSNFEPCGLSQMISMRYGTIPVVYQTGGLADTVIPFDQDQGNGFVFADYSPKGFVEVVQKAVNEFQNKDEFNRLIQNAFKADFSWEHSAKKYQETYQCL